ncbi:phage tail protein [Paenibacillus sp. J22TS3]|uniref:phage tail protein n=1 Tax=Paenibacillus sp. J22TS3 TaxID=2807192 RepID=UPI001B14FAF2|nr:tail fiber protein [Paenibacillus sp. J22TS3]GIP23438.1 tail Collar domain-containing protein [Paenibacillus sp. J22TS3]
MSEPYLGEIRMFAGNFPPAGWAFCNGALLPISENEPLFALIGTTYGGNGVTTFALPDLSGRLPVHTGQSRVDGITYLLGQKAGVEAVTLTTNQLPRHSHPINANMSSGELVDPTNNVWGLSSSMKPYSSAAPTGSMSPSAIRPAGNSQPHSNMMPYLPISFIIALNGVYPSRD